MQPIRVRRGDGIKVTECPAGMAEAVGWPEGRYMSMTCDGTNAVAIVPVDAVRADVVFAIRWLHGHHECARKAASWWVNHCLNAYDRVSENDKTPPCALRISA